MAFFGPQPQAPRLSGMAPQRPYLRVPPDTSPDLSSYHLFALLHTFRILYTVTVYLSILKHQFLRLLYLVLVAATHTKKNQKKYRKSNLPLQQDSTFYLRGGIEIALALRSVPETRAPARSHQDAAGGLTSEFLGDKVTWMGI